MSAPVTTSSPLVACGLHKTHSPGTMTVELHHVIPVAWQQAWLPAVAPYPGRDQAGRGPLWDARTLACCPTGHRNVHVWIVRFMRALPAGCEDPLQALKLARSTNGGVQAQWGLEALVRWKQYGGQLQRLVDAHQWGIA